MPPCRILHVIGSMAPRYGGPSFALRAMGAGLAARGAQVVVASTDADGVGRLDVPLDRPVVEGGVEYRYFARTMHGEWKFSWGLTRWVLGHAGEFDVVHVHAAFSYATIAGCRAARLRGVPYVLRPLGTLDPWSLGQRSWKKRPYFALIERSHLEHAAAIHVTSQSEADAIARLGYARLTRVIPLGVEVKRRDAARVRREGPLRLVFLSRLHPKKEVPVVLEAVRAVLRAGVPVELTIAGTGEPAYEAEMRALGAAPDLREHVRFVGHMEGEAKWATLAEADVYVLPSRQENFGIAVAEALAVGLPVIVSDQVAIASDIRAADAGIVVPVDASRLADAIRELASDPARRERMSANAVDLARARYSWARTCDQLLDLYQDVAAAGPSGSRRMEPA